MANSLANSFEIGSRLFHDYGALLRDYLTAGIFSKVGWSTHEHETALPPLPPSQKRLLRL
jgi:hypothetical protein